MRTRTGRWLLVLGAACGACAPSRDASVVDAETEVDAAPSTPAQPAPPRMDAGLASTPDTGPVADATGSAEEASAPQSDAGPTRPAIDASAPPHADFDAGHVVPDAAVEAGPAPSDSAVALDGWTFQPDASLQDAMARRTIMPDIPEAENLFFTEEGRLFVSGGESVYEIKRDAAGTWSKTDLFDENCLVEGITHANGYIYGVCSLTELDTFAQAYLLGAALTATPHMQIIGRLEDLGIPNGMDADRQGNLYTTYSGSGTIAKLVLAEPLKLGRVEVWAKDLPIVNGLRFLGDFVYFTTMSLGELGTRFGRIPIQRDGSAGTPEILLTRALTLFDDLGAFEGGQLVTDFVAGSILFFRDGKVLGETPALTFYGPSSVTQGRPPLFRPNQLLVTEKGLFGVRGETDGDRLSVFDL